VEINARHDTTLTPPQYRRRKPEWLVSPREAVTKAGPSAGAERKTARLGRRLLPAEERSIVTLSPVIRFELIRPPLAIMIPLVRHYAMAGQATEYTAKILQGPGSD
jgi:hypothetical protein